MRTRGRRATFQPPGRRINDDRPHGQRTELRLLPGNDLDVGYGDA